MRVAHIHRIAGIGGSERHLLTLLPALAARGIEPLFVGLDVAGAEPEPFYRELARHGIPAVRLRSRGDLDPLLALRLPLALRRLHPDIVHTHLVHADVYGTAAATVVRIPLVSTKHNDDPFRAGRFRVVERALAHRAAAVVAITDAVRGFTIDRIGLPPEKVRTIHYGLDAPPDAWARDAVEPPRGRMLLSVGRLIEQKGHEVSIRALPAIRKAHPDAYLAIVGEGPLRPELERLADELGVADAVLLPGRSGDVAAWMRRAEIFLHPTRWEGFGLVILEAMHLGLPIVGTRVSALPELVDHASGVLVEPEDERAVASAVVELLGDRQRRDALGRGARERARTAFSVARMADATAELYRSVVAAARSPAAHESAV